MEEASHSGRVLGGRYELGERLGAGGWGSVYAAVQTDLGRPVAIKVLHTSVALAPDGLVRFEREAKAAAALGHPNIAQVSDFQALPGEPPFLVMEMLTGQTLGATMRAAGRLAPSRVAWIAYQVLAGLDVAHRAGIIHRDIKPDNVFLVSMAGVADFVKLLDFGIAKLSGDESQHHTTTGTMLGSPAFMAPEQVRAAYVDHRVDLYALGATMYLALSGRQPYEAPNVHALLLAITEQRPVPLHVLDPSIDVALSAVVERAMHKDPNGRFASAEEMRGALEPWLGGMAAHASSTARAHAPAHAPAPAPRMVSPASITTGPIHNSMTPGYGPAPTPSFGSAGAATPHHPYGAVAQHAMTPMAPMMQHGPPPSPRGGGAVVGLLVAVVLLLLLLVGGGVAGAMYYARSASTSAAAAATSNGAVAPAAPTAPGANGAGGTGATGTTTAAGTTAANAPAGAAAPGGGAGGAGGARKTAPAGPAAGRGVVPIAPGVTPASPAAPAIATDAGAKKQFAGSSFRIGGGSFGTYDIEASKTAIMARAGAINACYAATEFDAPDHQFTNWTFQVDPAGNVKSVGRTTSFDPHPKFDACIIPVLRTVKWPASASGGSPSVSFTSRTADNP